jgi:hypothetical protein
MKTMLLALAVVLGGCVSGKVYRHDVAELKGKVAVLEAQVKEKDEAIKTYEMIYRETRKVYEKVKSRAKRGVEK